MEMNKHLTTEQAAEFLAVPVSMVKRLRERRLIPYVKIGYRTIRYALHDLEKYVQRNRVAAIGEAM